MTSLKYQIFWQNKAIDNQGVTEICILLIINKLQVFIYTCWPLTPTGGSGIVPNERSKVKKNFSKYQIFFTVGKAPPLTPLPLGYDPDLPRKAELRLTAMGVAVPEFLKNYAEYISHLLEVLFINSTVHNFFALGIFKGKY